MFSYDVYSLVQQEQHKDRLREAEQWRLTRAVEGAQRHKQSRVWPAMVWLGRRFARRGAPRKSGALQPG
jgi:hypothetical protein